MKRKPGGISDRIVLMKSFYQSISVTGLFRLFLSVSVSTPPVLRSIYKQRNFLNPSPGNPIWKCLVISSSLSSAPTFTEFIVGRNLRIARGDAKFPAFPHFWGLSFWRQFRRNTKWIREHLLEHESTLLKNLGFRNEPNLSIVTNSILPNLIWVFLYGIQEN